MDEVLNIKDHLCRAFVMGLGTGLPSSDAMRNMISWINLMSEKEGKALTEDYVISCIPRYITFLFNKS
jgi:hypothetical protein